MKSNNPLQKPTNHPTDENNEKDFSELNQAISNLIENQLDDPENEANEDQEQHQDNEGPSKYINHFFRENHLFKHEQIYYSPDTKKIDTSRVVLSPPVPYSKFGTPNLHHQRPLYPGNLQQNVNLPSFYNDEQPNMGGISKMCYSPVHSYHYGPGFGPMYGNYSSFYANPNANFIDGNYYSMGHQPNESHQMNKTPTKKNQNQNQNPNQNQKKKNKNKNKNKNANGNVNGDADGKTYISQSPNLKSLFANGKNGQCIKFVPNYVSNPLSNSSYEEHNQISLEAILTSQDKRTTLMIKNIPNKYTIATFLEEINIDFNCKYDVFYLPIDYGNKCNLGFAFINFVEPMHIIDFYEMYKGKKWKRFNSEKICDLVYAKIQGKKELIIHFEKGKVLLFESEDKRPLILQTPNPLPPVTIPSRLVNSFLMAYPFALYHSISKDKVAIDSLISF